MHILIIYLFIYLFIYAHPIFHGSYAVLVLFDGPISKGLFGLSLTESNTSLLFSVTSANIK